MLLICHCWILDLHTGVSLKTQELFALVFATRYVDLFTTYVSLYNTVMKIIFLGSSFSIVWYIRRHKIVRRSYDKDQDTFRHYFLLLPALILALFIHERFTFKEVICSRLAIKLLRVSLEVNSSQIWVIGYESLFDQFLNYFFSVYWIRYCGRFLYFWKLLPYFLSWCCCKGQEILTIWQGNMCFSLGNHYSLILVSRK